ncbi:sugar phosphate isomerase/epimerase [Burkholderia sp. Bp9143]|uniref:sugar phosphate isomerase/epimerase family protein n=1 Tax=Burkholderia sp. Bp9143 TaxID=2184574 RepID=UPI0016252DA6|nr:sugar phosphate isomerase/epimerase [Burkholderia sp. Bp9143]
MKIGAITNHISEDLEYGLKVLRELNLPYAEFCGAWNLSAGCHDEVQTEEIVRLVKASGCPVSAVSPRSFYMLPVLTTDVADAEYQQDLAAFRKSIALAKRLGTRLVRAMPFQRPPVIFGAHGAERFLANQNRAWPSLLRLYEEPLRIAEENDIVIAVETGFDTMLSSCSLAARMVEEMGSKHLRIMLDTGNNLYSTETPYPEAYEKIRDYLVHIQLKDARVDVKNGTVEFCALGEGDLAEYLVPLADALRADNFDGVVSLENVYRPVGDTLEESFRRSVGRFIEVFGSAPESTGHKETRKSVATSE